MAPPVILFIATYWVASRLILWNVPAASPGQCTIAASAGFNAALNITNATAPITSTATIATTATSTAVNTTSASACVA